MPVIAVCGRSAITEEQATDAGFRLVYALSEIEPDPAASMANAVSLLVDLGGRLALDLVLDRASD